MVLLQLADRNVRSQRASTPRSAGQRQVLRDKARRRSQFGQARLLLALSAPSTDLTDLPATAAMNLSDLPFRKLGEHAGIVLLRAALVLAVGFALVNSLQG